MKSTLSRLTHTLFPFVEDARTYSMKRFKADFIAALTVAIVASPQSMAYAIIAGVDPIYGLYASTFPVIIAALWGSSRYVLAGPTNAISMILYSTMAQLSIAGIMVSTLPESERLTFLFAMAILVGLIQLGMGLARLGELANFISHSVMVAFTSGAAILIALGQVKNFFGLTFSSPAGTLGLLKETVAQIPFLNPWSLGIALLTLAIAIALKRYVPKSPNSLIAIVAAAFLCAFFNLDTKGVVLASAVPYGLPPLSLPSSLSLSDWNALFLPAMAIALLGSVESLAIARTMASQRGDKLDGSQELMGQGLANIVAGFFSGIPGCGSFSRSAVNFMAGATSRFSAAMSGVLTLAALLALGPLVRYIPIPSLAALLLLICWNMIKWEEIQFTLRATRSDAAVFLITFAAVLVLDLEKAVFLGVLISLGLFLRKESHPHVRLLARHHLPDKEDGWALNCPYLASYVLEGPLFFGAVSELERSLNEMEHARHRILLLDISHVHLMDATGAYALKGFLKRCSKRGMKVIIAGGNDDVRGILARTGLTRGKEGAYLAGNSEGGFFLSTTLLLEACACQGCMQCAHGRRALEEAEKEQSILPECFYDENGESWLNLPDAASAPAKTSN